MNYQQQQRESDTASDGTSANDKEIAAHDTDAADISVHLCIAASDDGFSSDEEEESPNDNAVTCPGDTCQEYFNSLENGSRESKVLFAMAIGNRETFAGQKLLSPDDEPFCSFKNQKKELKPTLAELKKEVIRRSRAYTYNHVNKSTLPRPNWWKGPKIIEWLQKHPVPCDETNKDELAYVHEQLAEFTKVIEGCNMEETPAVTRNRFSTVTALRLYHSLLADDIRQRFVDSLSVKNRETLDARNSDRLPTPYFDVATSKFNDKSWVPNSVALPKVHEDFADSMPLPLDVDPIDVEGFKRRFTKYRAKMVLVLSRWRVSGSGADMRASQDAEDVNPDKDEHDTDCYDFIDGDDRKNFLQTEPTHVLYFWHLAWDFGILNHVAQVLVESAAADTDVPTVSNGSGNGNNSKKRSAGDMYPEDSSKKLAHSVDHLTQEFAQSSRQSVLQKLRADLCQDIREAKSRRFELLKMILHYKKDCDDDKDETLVMLNEEKKAISNEIEDKSKQIEKIDGDLKVVNAVPNATSTKK